MKDEDLLGLTADKLKWLRLPGMAQALVDLLKQAKHNNETTLETISKLADTEKASRIKSAVNRRTSATTPTEVVPWAPVTPTELGPSQVGGYSCHTANVPLVEVSSR